MRRSAWCFTHLICRAKGERGLAGAIQDALQQAIISNRGFTCALSQKDIGPAFHQMDFYQRNRSVFEMEASPFTAEAVLLMADVFPSRHPGEVGVALRAMWRTGHMERRDPKIISSDHPAVALTQTAPGGDLGICFYEFTEVFEKRIYTVLAFRLAPKAGGRLDVYFDGGFR